MKSQPGCNRGVDDVGRSAVRDGGLLLEAQPPPRVQVHEIDPPRAANGDLVDITGIGVGCVTDQGARRRWRQRRRRRLGRVRDAAGRRRKLRPRRWRGRGRGFHYRPHQRLRPHQQDPFHDLIQGISMPLRAPLRKQKFGLTPWRLICWDGAERKRQRLRDNPADGSAHLRSSSPIRPVFPWSLSFVCHWLALVCKANIFHRQQAAGSVASLAEKVVRKQSK